MLVAMARIFFLTRMLTHVLFAVANILVYALQFRIFLCHVHMVAAEKLPKKRTYKKEQYTLESVPQFSQCFQR